MKDTDTPRDVSGPPSPAPKLGPTGRASMDGSRVPGVGDAKSAAVKPPTADMKPATHDAAQPRDAARPADAAEPLSPEQKEWLRQRTPNAAIKEHINDVPPAQKVDPVYGYKVDSLEADHIVPFNKVCEKPGFAQLSQKDQLAVSNYEPNFMGLSRATNASKGDRSWSEWQGHRDYGPPPAKFREEMIRRENKLNGEIQAEIDRRRARPTL